MPGSGVLAAGRSAAQICRCEPYRCCESYEEKAKEIKDLCAAKGVEISALAYYPNTLEPDLEKRQSYIDHLYKLIDASAMLDVNMITTFVGRIPDKNVSENLEDVKEVWPPILDYAKEKA